VDQVLLFLDGEEFLRARAFRVPDETLAQSVLSDLDQLLSRLDGFLASARSVVVTINTIALPLARY